MGTCLILKSMCKTVKMVQMSISELHNQDVDQTVMTKVISGKHCNLFAKLSKFHECSFKNNIVGTKGNDLGNYRSILNMYGKLNTC